MNDVTTTNIGIEAFLKGKAKSLPIVEETISDRYTDQKGNPIPFKFKAINSTRIEEIKKDCTHVIYVKNQKIERFDSERYVAIIAVETTIFPDFKNDQLLKSYDCIDSCDLAHEILDLPGEYTTWVEKAFKVNGFDDKFEDLVGKAKN